MIYKKIIPLGYQVLIKQVDEDAKVSDGGIVTPDNEEQEQKSFGEVLEIGEKVTKVKVGDNVVYGTYAGDNIDLEKDAFVLVQQKFILAKLK